MKKRMWLRHVSFAVLNLKLSLWTTNYRSQARNNKSTLLLQRRQFEYYLHGLTVVCRIPEIQGGKKACFN